MINPRETLFEAEAALALTGAEPEGAALLPEAEPEPLVDLAAGRVELTTAEVAEGVKLAAPSSTVM